MYMIKRTVTQIVYFNSSYYIFINNSISPFGSLAYAEGSSPQERILDISQELRISVKTEWFFIYDYTNSPMKKDGLTIL